MKRKKGFSGGVFQGMNLQARISEAAFLSMLLKYKEAKKYLDDGYETWEEFCVEEIGMSDETLRRRFKALDVFGGETTRIMIGMGMDWKDIRMIDHVLTEEQKTQLKKGIIEIDGRKIPVTEQFAPEVQTAFDLLISRADSAIKGEKLLKTKVDGIEKEHRKEIKTYAAEIEKLQAMVPDYEDPEWALKYAEQVMEIFNQFDLALRRFAFDKRTFDDPVVPAKIGGLIEQMRTRVREFNTDWNVAQHEAWGEEV